MGDPDLPGTILRYPMIYGPNDGGWTFDVVKCMLDARPVIPLDEQVARWRWSRGYAENVAWATVFAVTQEQARNRMGCPIGNGPSASPAPQAGPFALSSCPRVTSTLVVDTTRIRAELGYMEVVPQEEALRRTVEWQRAHPPEKYDPKDFDYETEDMVLAHLEQTG